MYIYLFEDGNYGVSKKAPLSGDIGMIADGTLIVLHVEYIDGEIVATEVLEDGTEEPASKAGEEDDETGNYHYGTSF